MPKEGFCKICKFFDKPYRQNERRIFQKLVREGASLRRLEVFFEALSLKVRKDTINSHIHKCMNPDIRTQRIYEKDIKREKTSKGIRRVSQRVKEFFVKPTVIIEECPHSQTEPFYDVNSEQVYARCQKCGQILGHGLDPHEIEKRQNKRRNLEILRRLSKK